MYGELSLNSALLPSNSALDLTTKAVSKSIKADKLYLSVSKGNDGKMCLL